MEEIKRIEHVGIRVRQLERSRRFYEELGFEFLLGPVGPEPVAIMEHPSGVNINFILNAAEDSPEENMLMDVETKYPGYTHMALEISDYESAIGQIRDLGIKVTGEVEYEGARFFFIRDPDNNVIEFHRPAQG